MFLLEEQKCSEGKLIYLKKDKNLFVWRDVFNTIKNTD